MTEVTGAACVPEASTCDSICEEAALSCSEALLSIEAAFEIIEA